MSSEAPPPQRHSDGGADAGSAQAATAAVALEAIEQRFVEVVRLLAAEPQLAPFKTEYEKIHRLLVKSREGERRLIMKVNELKQELSSHQVKTETAIALSQEDEESIAGLRKEIEKAWAMADTAHAREVESRKAIQVLKKQVAELDALVERSAGLSLGQEAFLRELIATKKEREDEHSVLRAQLDRLAADHRAASKRATAIQEKEVALAGELEARTAEYQSLLAQLEEEQRERLAKEEAVRSYRASTAQVVAALDAKLQQTQQLSAEEKARAREATAALQDALSMQQQLEERQQRFQAESDRLSAVEAHNAQLKAQLPAKQFLLKERTSEVNKLEKQVRGAERRVREQQQELQQLVATRDELLLAANAASAEMEEQLQLMQKEEKSLVAVEAQLKKTMLLKSKAIADNSSKENERSETEGRRTQEESKRRRLEQDLSASLAENEALRKQLFELELVQSKELNNAQASAGAYRQTIDQIRRKNADAKSLRDLLGVYVQKQKVQQDLLDRVTADRNRAEKQLREAESERRQLAERHDTKREDIDNMKKDLVATEAALCQLHTVNKQLQREITNTEQRASHLLEDCGHAATRIDALQQEVQQLQHIIADCDAEMLKQTMRLSAITNERNIIAAQLIRRNEELTFLYDKVQLQQSALDRGAEDYDLRVKDIVVARDQLKEFRLRCRLILVRLRYMHELQRKQMAGTKQLTHERARVRALTEELRKPLNVHRWREQEGSGPELLDSLAKVNMLQQAFIARCDELKSVTAQIEQKEAEYKQLREKLARLPGPEAAEDLALYKENIEKRQEQIAAMETELAGVEGHAEVLAEEVRQLNTELAAVKKGYFDAKAKQDALKRERRALRRTWGPSSTAVARLALSNRGAAATTDFTNTAPVAMASSGAADDHDALHHPQQQRVLSKNGRRYGPGVGGGNSNANNNNNNGSHQPAPLTPREAAIAREDELLHVLSTGAPAPSFPLHKPKNQKQFVGGGFALTR